MDAPPPPRRVLIVDDREDVAQMMALLLRALGHDAQTASDGASALALAREFRPDIVFLDIGLPGMNGYDVARRLRDDPALRGCVLVACTGYGGDDDRARAAHAGFDHHLVKPIGLVDIERVLTLPGADRDARGP
jgi:CheY-like chemotaxis protein